MAWKSEKWLSEVFPGKERIYEEYRLLPRRELAITAASVLDCALAELLSLRVLDKPNEYIEFLGLNEDGRAPCGSMGARIQLALLLGLLSDRDAAMLRTIKNIRNKIAHRVKSDLNSPEVLPLIYKLLDQLTQNTNILIAQGRIPGPVYDASIMRDLLPTTPEVGAAVIISALTLYQAYFHQMSERLPRITEPDFELVRRTIDRAAAPS